MSSGIPSLATQVVRAGLGIRGEDPRRTFWDDFNQVCTNTDGMADLLGVRPEQVAGWSEKVRGILDQVRKDDDNQAASRKQVIPTGDAGTGTMNPF